MSSNNKNKSNNDTPSPHCSHFGFSVAAPFLAAGESRRSSKMLVCKKIHFNIEEKSDTTINVDIDNIAAELGIKPVDDTTADTAGVASARARCYEPRSYVSCRNCSNNNAIGDLIVVMASMMECQQRNVPKRNAKIAVTIVITLACLDDVGVS
jgi:hypothetical protein